MSTKGYSARTLLILIGDILIVPFSYVAGYYLRFGTLFDFREKFAFWFIPLIVLSYLAIFHFFDLYRLQKNYFTANSFLTISLSVALAAVFVSFLNYAIFLLPIGRGILVISNLILLFSAFVWRGFCYQLFKYLIKPTRLIIVGAGKAGQEIAQVTEQAGDDFEVVGIIEDDGKKIEKPILGKKTKILGTSDQILALAEKHRIDQLILALGKKESPQLSKHILSARLKGIEVIDMPDMYQAIKRRIPINYVEHSANILVMKVKRLIDIIVSSFIILNSWPLFPLIALLIKINSRGPVFYTQKRVGKNESLFPLYKFRSMIDKAEEEEALWADEKDKRITLVGKILRKLHLDELPQFWNVVKGDMSLVGPRPERPEFVEELKKKIPYYSLRHFMKPGMTGWAQVNYPYASSLKDSQEKMEYDLYYVYHMNLLFDVRILLRTAQKIILGKKVLS
jgi:exopolysaccharide biosynthesis polyprenyl glycosylphosphotransferase